MKTLKIGIVEDDMIIANAISEMLVESGYNVTKPAKRYSEAIAMIEDEAPDLLLLDITILGKMDGIEVARTVQKSFNIPYIFLTANTDFDTISRAKEVHPSAFLAKPVTRPQLHAAIEIALGNFSNGPSDNTNTSAATVASDSGFFVKLGTAFRRIMFSEVLFAESRDNYLRLMIADGQEVMIRCTMADFLAQAPGFLQTHRGFAVAGARVTEVLTDEVRIGPHTIPLTKTYRTSLLLVLGIR